MQQVLHPAVAHKPQVAQGVADGQLTPKAPADGVLVGRQQVEVGVGQLGPAGGAQVAFAGYQRLAAGQTQTRENQAQKIGG